jgi:SAM-dependent methyltransferase
METTEYELMDVNEDRMWWYRALHGRLLEELAGFSGRILDAGCGTGRFLAQLGRRYPAAERFGCELAETVPLRASVNSGASIVCGTIDSQT